MVDHIRAIPGVNSAADVKFVPLSGSTADDHVWMEGGLEKINPFFNWVSPGYFKTLNIPLVTGRDFDAHDTRKSPRVAIVNEAFVERLGIGREVISKKFRREATPSEPEMDFEIVGVVKNAKYRDLREDFTPTVFLPMTQQASPEPGQQIMIRSQAPPASLVNALKRAIVEVNPEIPFYFSFFKTRIHEGLLRERLLATLSGFFGFLATLLATIGLYGVISYMVGQRTSEIGMRMALGAGRGEVVRMILSEAGMLLGIGLAAGAILAMAAGQAASALLYGLKAYDAGTLAAAIVALAMVGALASYIPARRASQLDPMTALRDE
jgi:predicted permease